MNRRIAIALAGVLLGAAGCATPVRDQAAPPDPAPPAPAPPVESESPDPVYTPPSVAPSPTPSLKPARPAPPPYDVAAVQRRLAELKYYLGPIDGNRGSRLRSAVMAFQKVNRLAADGVVGKATLAALQRPRQPKLRASAPSHRVEIDLTLQVLYVVDGGAIVRILPVSSGNGARYRQKNGGYARALTPTGWYRVQRRIIGVREADLGTLYDPQYFYRGWAIHGSNSVPAYPASHGCVRVTRADAKWLLKVIGVGTAVYLYGGEHTFTAGSSAPGTDTPSGDTPSSPSPSPTATRGPSASSSPSPRPSPTAPLPTSSPSPSASPSATTKSKSPSPSASPSGR